MSRFGTFLWRMMTVVVGAATVAGCTSGSPAATPSTTGSASPRPTVSHAASAPATPTPATSATAQPAAVVLSKSGIGPAVFDAAAGGTALVAVLGEPEFKDVYKYPCGGGLDREWRWGDLSVGLQGDVVVNWFVLGPTVPAGLKLPLGVPWGATVAQAEAVIGSGPEPAYPDGTWAIFSDSIDWRVDSPTGTVTAIGTGTQMCD